MTRILVNVSADSFFEAHGGLGIVGPASRTSEAWVVYVPGELPCICDTFEDASRLMNKALKKIAKREATLDKETGR